MNKEKKHQSNILLVLVYIVLIIVLLGISFTQLMKGNTLQTRLDELTAEMEKLEEENAKLEYELSLPLDEENIKKIAKEQHGLVDPGDEYYIGD